MTARVVNLPDSLARRLAESNKPLLTIPSPANQNLLEMGADVVGVDGVAAIISSAEPVRERR